jgi:TRAP-type C4-dicarboxylate transport system permease small subunit
MAKLTGVVEGLSKEMDKLAGYCVVGVMLLVVSNVILRKVFKLPISGTYEIVGYLTALAISLALAYCAVRNAHIGVDYIIGKFPKSVRTTAAIAINLLSMVFWGCAALQTGRYAESLMKSGVVSSTAQIPVFPVVFLIGLGLVVLCLVCAVRFFESIAVVLEDTKVDSFAPKPGLIAEVKEGN